MYDSQRLLLVRNAALKQEGERLVNVEDTLRGDKLELQFQIVRLKDTISLQRLWIALAFALGFLGGLLCHL